jgi:hypothetical protein
MIRKRFRIGLLSVALAFVFWVGFTRAADDGKNWPMYNCEVIGSRHNRGETAIDKSNAGRLEEKWRFPARDSDLVIGVVHATSIVVDGCVYFGTATDPAFYKLGPDGKLRWSYRNPAHGAAKPVTRQADEKARNARFQTSPNGILPRRSSARTRSSSATSAAGSTPWTARREPSAGNSTPAARNSPAPTRSTSSSPRPFSPTAR